MKPDYQHGAYTVISPDVVRSRSFTFEGDDFNDARAKAFEYAEHLRESGLTPVVVTVSVTEVSYVETLI